MTYRKVMFRGAGGSTAGIVITDEWIEKNKANFVSEVSRLYPRSEALKMQRIYISPEFETWDGAYAFEFGDPR